MSAESRPAPVGRPDPAAASAAATDPAATPTAASGPATTTPAGATAPARALVLVRVHDRPGALERVLGLLRRRALPARPFALINRVDQELELALEFEDIARTRERLRIELLSLEDVRDVAIYVTEPHEPPEA